VTHLSPPKLFWCADVAAGAMKLSTPSIHKEDRGQRASLSRTTDSDSLQTLQLEASVAFKVGMGQELILQTQLLQTSM
jgi:hypothetical protein